MNKRFCKLGNLAAKAFFLTAICGVTYSCKDDYTLDDTTPSWLGSSIYEYLEEEGNYTNFVKLINDLEYKEVLARTGSKTLFVANDDAFKSFYSNNPWGVTSYDQLSLSQKKILLNGSMINNAYLLEMMSSTPAGGGDNDVPTRGECMRRETALDVTDTIPHLFGNDLPVNYSPNEKEKDYWARFREKGIYLALDGTPSMMAHFLNAQLSNKLITDDDFKRIVGVERDKNDAYIFDNKVIKQDVTCQNGYVNVLDKVNITPQNMAEVLRTNKNTKIFSHMLDRFSAPFYNSTLTERARLIYGNQVDSVFEKRYFAIRSQGIELYSDRGTDPTNNPNGNTVFNTSSDKPLPFDPGWNSYYVNDKTSEMEDMAVIFCPNDKKLMDYFFTPGAGGNFLVKAYAGDLVNEITADTEDMDKVYHALDCIPRNVIRALVSNLMKESFISSVPSKFETIKNSAQDPMFDDNNDYHRGNIQEVLLANNGVIYVMDEVTTPAEYAAVSAPAYVEQDKKIFNWAIQSPSLCEIPTNYYAYLLAMSSRFSFFVPQDKDFTYIDPVSFKSATAQGSTLVGKAYKIDWDEKTSAPKVNTIYECLYDLKDKSCTLGNILSGTINTNTVGNRLKDMLETHTVIHEDNSSSIGIDETQTGMECDKHYYITKNGAVIYAENATKRKAGMTLKGGWQLNGINQIEPGTNTGIENSTVIGFDDKSAQTYSYGNGFAYMIDVPVQPTIESVYSILYNNKNFSKFFELCEPSIDALIECGITDKATQERYTIFTDKGGIPCFDNGGNKISSATNVRFFNNYNYTVYVPTNEAMEQAFAKGLPTWTDIEKIIEKYPTDSLTSSQRSDRDSVVIAMATSIVNFVRNHFQDNSVFADTPKMSTSVFETATFDSKTGLYSKVHVSSDGASNVANATGHVCHTTNDKNLIARDYIIKTTSSRGDYIEASSSAVIHGIDHVLDYKTLTNGRYDSDWKTLARARKYLSKYRLTK